MRTNVFLAAAAALLAVPTIVTILDDSRSFTSYEDVPRLFEGFTPDKVAIVQISKAKLDDEGKPITGPQGQPERASLTLQKTNDGWVVASGKIAGAPVRDDAVAESVLAHFEAIRRDSEALVATRADEGVDHDARLEEYELTENLGMLIQCYDNSRQPVAELYRGRSARGVALGNEALKGYFVRRKDRDDVILYEEAKWKIEIPARTWIDRQAIPMSANGKVVRVKIQNAQGELECTKDDPKEIGWKVSKAPEDAGPVRVAELDAAVTRIVRSQVLTYKEKLLPNPVARQNQLKAAGLATAKLMGEVELDDGTVYTVRIGKKLTDKNEYYALFSNRPFIVTVPSYLQTTFVRDIAKYFDPSPESVKDGDKDKEGGDKDGDKDKGGDGNKDDGR